MDIVGERILIFGDSLTHHGADGPPEAWDVDTGSSRQASAPGDLLASLLLERGAAAVRTDARVGRSAWNFFAREDASGLLATDQAFRPTTVIFFLGTNDCGLDATKDAGAFAQLRDSFAGAEVWAIGPPVFRDPTLTAQAEIVYDTLRQVFGAARVIDARPLSSTSYRAGDGVHFQPAGARPLAIALADVLGSTFTLAADAGPWIIGSVALAAAWMLWKTVRGPRRAR
jgi:lysophospholipase L1-like esterase